MAEGRKHSRKSTMPVIQKVMFLLVASITLALAINAGNNTPTHVGASFEVPR